MSVTIHIDDEVFRQASRPGGNVTLRLVVDEHKVRPEPEPAGPPRGPLATLMERGELTPGEKLYWNRPRLKVTHRAVVLASGEIESAGRRYGSPSDAASALAGSSINGWTAWCRERDGKALHSLR